jgi:hypothetical protein
MLTLSNQTKTTGVLGDPAAWGLRDGQPAATTVCLEPMSIGSPASAVGCWRRHMVLSVQRRPDTQFLQTEHCISGFAASERIWVGSDEVVLADSGKHRRTGVAS